MNGNNLLICDIFSRKFKYLRVPEIPTPHGINEMAGTCPVQERAA